MSDTIRTEVGRDDVAQVSVAETSVAEGAAAGEGVGFIDSGAAAFADAETREILNLLGDDAAGGSCCGGSCCA